MESNELEVRRFKLSSGLKTETWGETKAAEVKGL